MVMEGRGAAGGSGPAALSSAEFHFFGRNLNSNFTAKASKKLRRKSGKLKH